jgi:iron complex outermembrane receptor protein
VLKLKNVTFDADYFHIHFDNSYSCIAPLHPAVTTTLLPAAQLPSPRALRARATSISRHGLGVYLNASYNKATYEGNAGGKLHRGRRLRRRTAQIVTAPSGLWVQQTPSDIETEGVTYQHKGVRPRLLQQAHRHHVHR